MAVLTVFLLMVDLLLVVSADQMKAKSGDTISLPCRSADSRSVVAVEWNRPDLKPEYVLLFRGGRIDSYDQHPSFKNRVNLQDRQMKDGDVSLVLNNVTTEDSGKYECRVDFSKSNRRKRSYLPTDPIRTIQLQVSPPGDKRGQTGDKRGQGHQDVSSAGSSGLIAALVVLAVIVLMIPAVIIVIIRRRLTLYHPPPHNEAEKPALL